MSGVMKSLDTVNSLIRTLLAIGAAGAIGVGGWWGYSTYNAVDIERRQSAEQLSTAKAEITALNSEVSNQRRELERLATSLRLLKVDHRLARLTVISQEADAKEGELVTVIEWVELDNSGKPLDEPRRFRIQGDIVYIDNWVVKFDDHYVEQADLERSTSLVLFRRIFGERQQPAEGYSLDKVGVRPRAYGRSGAMSEFERQIWSDFWLIANDQERARSLGIRSAHGEAVSIKVKPGRRYNLLLRASDGLSIVPDTPPPKKEAA